MDLIKIIDDHTKTALKQAEELQTIVETTAGFNAIQHERARQMLADSHSILSQVLQSLDDAQSDTNSETNVVRPDPKTWR